MLNLITRTINYSEGSIETLVHLPEFPDIEGDLDDDGGVEFTYNIAPHDLEDLDCNIQTTEQLIQKLDDHIAELTKFRDFVKALGTVDEVESDFYWSEQDLLIRIALYNNRITLKQNDQDTTA